MDNNIAYLQEIFNQAGFIREIGLQLKEVGPGWVVTELPLLPKHMQQDSVVHAGVQATMADHTGGAAGATLVHSEQRVLTVEFKINLLRPARGEFLRCRAEVLKPGKRLIVVESSVESWAGEESKLVSKATVTLAVVEQVG